MPLNDEGHGSFAENNLLTAKLSILIRKENLETESLQRLRLYFCFATWRRVDIVARIFPKRNYLGAYVM